MEYDFDATNIPTKAIELATQPNLIRMGFPGARSPHGTLGGLLGAARELSQKTQKPLSDCVNHIVMCLLF